MIANPTLLKISLPLLVIGEIMKTQSTKLNFEVTMEQHLVICNFQSHPFDKSTQRWTVLDLIFIHQQNLMGNKHWEGRERVSWFNFLCLKGKGMAVVQKTILWRQLLGDDSQAKCDAQMMRTKFHSLRRQFATGTCM